MAILEIQTGENNPILRTRSVEIKKIDSKLKKFAKDLKETMTAKDGLGLAAPQVGVDIRMIAATLNFKSKQQNVAIMINPRILSHSEETEAAEEGCLSLPGIYKKVERFKEIVVEFDNVEGERHILKLEGLNARIVQHEIDHLDGIFFIDRVVEMGKNPVVL